jgi:glycerol kinase
MLYRLTGGLNGGIHKTDCTNASRTMFMNLKTLDWDAEILEFFGVDRSCLPDIVSNGEIYGKVTYNNTLLNGCPIAGEFYKDSL